MQTAVVIDKFNPEDSVGSLRVDSSSPIPSLSRDSQVLLKLTHRPINPVDLVSLTGNWMAFQPKNMPAVPGVSRWEEGGMSRWEWQNLQKNMKLGRGIKERERAHTIIALEDYSQKG